MSTRSAPWMAVLAAAWLLAPAGSAADEEAAPLGLERSAVEARRDAVTTELHSLPDDAASAERRAGLMRLERVLSQTLDSLRRSEKLAGAVERLRGELAGTPGGEGGAPEGGGTVGLTEQDAALDTVAEEETVLARARDAARAATAALEASRTDLEERERAAREAGNASDGLPVEIARAELALRRLQATNAKSAVERHELELELGRARLAALEERVVPRPEEIERRLDEIEQQVARVQRARSHAGAELEEARKRLERFQRRQDASPEPGAEAEREARRAEVANYEKSFALLGEELDRLARAKELVRRRGAALSPGGADTDALRAWVAEGEEAVETLEREQRLDRAELEALSQEIDQLGDGDDPWRARQREALKRSVQAYESGLDSLEQALRRERRLLRVAEPRAGAFDPVAELHRVGRGIAELWTFEITSSEDRSITVGKIVSAILTFLLGLLLARWATHWMGSRLFPRIGIAEGAGQAYESLLYYALVGIVFLTTLRTVNIPLTAFAVVGGALAIGFGFGSQNIVNNFISGLILLAERPIKVGDLVQVEATYGNVERIGLRSTRVRTGENIHVIVPNSAFLENNVTNWTHNDHRVRVRISVGVVYGSPTREVADRLARVLAAHDRVMKVPEPIVLFTGFGDNSLDFEVHFWVRIRNMMERHQIESDLRFDIDDSFREAGIVIAFPQRDVHLDAAAPLEIRVTGPAAPGAAPASGPGAPPAGGPEASGGDA